MTVCQIFYFVFFFEGFKEYGQNFIKDDEYLSFIGATAMVVNGCSKLLGGLLLDYFDFISVYKVVMVALVAQIASINYMVQTSERYMISNITMFAAEGVFIAMLPVLTLKIFGLKRGPQIFSYVQSAEAVSALLCLLIVSTVKPEEGYLGIFTISLVLTLSAAVCAFQLEENVKFKYTDVYIGQVNSKIV